MTSMDITRVWQFLTGWPDALFGKADPPVEWMERLEHPADVFALSAAVLRRSGAYTRVVDSGPGKSLPLRSMDEIQQAVTEWRAWLNSTQRNGPETPVKISEPWTRLWEKRKSRLFDIAEDSELLAALVDSVTIADELSQGCGLPIRHDLDQKYDFLLRDGWKQLEPKQFGSTLCSDAIDPRAARVLPKLHTPTSGLTLRSFTHNLALCETDEVQPRWFMVPGARGNPMNQHHVNLLVVPWPEVTMPSQITKSERFDKELGAGGAMSGRHGGRDSSYFEYNLEEKGSEAAEKLDALCEETVKRLGSLDGVVLPELALTWEDYRLVRKRVLSRSCLFVSGVSQKGGDGEPNENFMCVDVPLSKYHAIHFRQGKHHRWRLDGRQIRNYGIGARLNPAASYWEDISISDRRLLLFVLRPWLVTSVLICEDLARNDPVGELLRSVGPHLVIALLMDGPQLSNRWPSRYASTLADDPGSSVLTVSSLGMVGLSRLDTKSKPSRTVAMWKDAYSGESRELDIADGASALALTISVEHKEEVTADGRSDGGTAAFPVLTGFHSIHLPEQPSERLRIDPWQIIEDERHRYLSPHEAATLARLVQQDVKRDPFPRVLKELTGEALAIAKVIWRELNLGTGKKQVWSEALNERELYTGLPTTEQTDTAEQVIRWAMTNTIGGTAASRTYES